MVVPVDVGWSDVGSWSALWEVQPSRTATATRSAATCYRDGVPQHAGARRRAAWWRVVGVDDLVVVETDDAVLVAHKDQVQRRQGGRRPPQAARSAPSTCTAQVYRPWGCYDGIDAGERFQVKRITVKPGAQLSLQMHHHRAEHWIVVSGTARVTCGDKVDPAVARTESTYIPIGVKHRLENPGKLPLRASSKCSRAATWAKTTSCASRTSTAAADPYS